MKTSSFLVSYTLSLTMCLFHAPREDLCFCRYKLPKDTHKRWFLTWKKYRFYTTLIYNCILPFLFFADPVIYVFFLKGLVKKEDAQGLTYGNNKGHKDWTLENSKIFVFCWCYINYKPWDELCRQRNCVINVYWFKGKKFKL